MWIPCSRVCMYRERFFLLEGQLYQERLGVCKYFGNNPKRCLENKENAYIAKKDPGAFLTF